MLSTTMLLWPLMAVMSRTMLVCILPCDVRDLFRLFVQVDGLLIQTVF